MSDSVKPWDLINPNKPRSEKELAEQRLSICHQCPRFGEATKHCKECGCFMPLKVKLKDAKCPLGKW
jgi:hypothetical protein